MNWLYFVRDLFGFPSLRRTRAFLIFFLYFIAINIISYFIMSIDKKCAKKGKQRIPENVIFSLSILGGGAGVVVAMNRVRHKRKKRSFTVGMPIITALNVIVFVFLVYLLYM